MAKKLYGTDPDQVPTNSDLGTMAYQDNGNVNVDKITVSRNNAVEGAIGVSTSIDGTLYIAGDSGIQFRSDDILPTNSSGAYTGGVLDIGDNGARFRAIYLSDGVNFGDAGGSGTPTSNTLDSYEEGTWNGTDGSGAGLTLTLVNNTYTKVGRLVTCAANVVWPTNSSTSLARVTLPFTSVTTNSQQGGVIIEQDYNSTTTLTAAINYTDGVIFRPRGYGNLTNANLSGKRLRFLLTYHAA